MGGVALYVKDSVTILEENYNNLNISNNDIECLWPKFKPGTMRTMIIGTLYRQPDGDIAKFFEYLNPILESLSRLHQLEVHLVGDLNIDLSDKHDKDANKFKSRIKLAGLRQLIKSPTRITQKKKSLIDIHVTNCRFVADSGVYPLNISDHLLTFLRKKKTPAPKRPIEFTARSYSKYDEASFLTDLTNINWQTRLEGAQSTEAAWEDLESYLKLALDINCPIRLIKAKNRKPEWLTLALPKSIKKKDKQLKIAINTNSAEDWNLARLLRNSIKNKVKYAKKAFYTDLLERHKNDGRAFWRTVNEVTSGGVKSHETVTLFNVNKDKLKPEDASSHINEFFANVGNTLDTLRTAWTDPGRSTPHIFSFRPFTPLEVSKLQLITSSR